ncbi:unnamed protein product [Cochlearia groenlandica]
MAPSKPITCVKRLPPWFPHLAQASSPAKITTNPLEPPDPPDLCEHHRIQNSPLFQSFSFHKSLSIELEGK